MARSQAFRRPPHYAKTAARGYDDEDDDEDAESSGGFLPFATTATGSADGAATIKSPVKRVFEQRAVAPDSSASSASSAAAPPSSTKQREARGDYNQAPPASALSPRHRSELSKLSPRVRKDGSEDTPSMGSSFSDLDGMFFAIHDSERVEKMLMGSYRCKYLAIGHRRGVHESYATWQHD